MDNYRDFTYDKKRFGDYSDMVKDFHAQGLKYVLMVVRMYDIFQNEDFLSGMFCMF